MTFTGGADAPGDHGPHLAQRWRRLARGCLDVRARWSCRTCSRSGSPSGGGRRAGTAQGGLPLHRSLSLGLSLDYRKPDGLTPPDAPR